MRIAGLDKLRDGHTMECCVKRMVYIMTWKDFHNISKEKEKVTKPDVTKNPIFTHVEQRGNEREKVNTFHVPGLCSKARS